MKKSLLPFFVLMSSALMTFGQATLIVEAPSPNGTTQQRAPNGTAAHANMQACALVLQSELAQIPATSTLTQFGFTLTTGTGGNAVAGNFTVYLQNTADLTYSKGTTWSNITTGMTSVYASIMTIPLTANTASIILNLSTPFVYNGQGLYVAYDWSSSGPYASTPATYHSESLILNPGSAAGGATSGAPTLTTSAFRPAFLFGFANPYSNDVKILGIESPGRIPAVLSASHNVKALVLNSSNITLNNISVTMTVSGANAFTDTQVITSLAPGSTTMVTFAAYNPLQPGPQTVSVSVPSDQFNANNLATYPQSVTCNVWGQNPASGSYTSQSVGFATGSGILVTTMTMPVNASLTGVRGAIAQNAPTVGNNLYGVLLNSSGNIVATTNTITITTAMLGTFVGFNFPSPQTISAFTQYYIGFAQTANATAYHPAGTQAAKYLPGGLYYYTGINGGALTQLTQNFGYFGLEAMFQHTVTISAASQTITCGNSATLNALSSTNYSWSTGATTPSVIVSPTLNTNYTVSATNTLGCAANTTVGVTVSPIVISTVITPTVACAGNSMTLTASGATNYTWSATTGTFYTAMIIDSPTANITYTLKGSDPNGCQATKTIPLSINPLPIVNVSTNSPSVCLGKSVTVVASGNAASYLWSQGNTTSSVSLGPQSTEVFTVTGKSAAGCEQIKTVTVTVNTFTPGITSPTAICQGQEITLFASGATTLVWDNSSIFSSITVTPPVTTGYTVTGKGANGCQGSNSTTVTVHNNPTVTTVATRTSMCVKETTSITASGANSYSWSTGSQNAQLVFTSTVATVHNLVVTGQNLQGCTHTVAVQVRVNSCNGIEEISEEPVTLFPNPTSGILYIELQKNLDKAGVEIYNSAGQKVLVLPVPTSGASIDLHDLSPGVYHVNLMQGGQTIKSQRIIKQ